MNNFKLKRRQRRGQQRGNAYTGQRGTTFAGLTNTSPAQPGYQATSSDCCPPTAPYPFLVEGPSCNGQLPSYAGTMIFDSTLFTSGPPLRVAVDKMSQDIDTFDDSLYAATFAAGKWTSEVAGATNDGKVAHYVGVQITSTNTQQTIGNLTVDVTTGVIGAGAQTKVNQMTFLQKGTGALQDIYVIIPLLREEANSQRVQLNPTTFAFTAGAPPVQTGLTVNVTGPLNQAGIAINAFLLNRGILAAAGYYNHYVSRR